MLHRKVLMVFLLALVLGCTGNAENEKRKKTKNAELEKVYMEQLMSYNDEIRDKIWRLNALQKDADREWQLKEVGRGHFRNWEQKRKEVQQVRDSLNVLYQKRQELKIKALEQIGYLPEWWIEKSSTEN